MKFIIKPFAEIMVKSKPVRRRYLQTLQYNLNLKVKKISENLKVSVFYDKLELNIKNPEIKEEYDIPAISKALARTPWVDFFLEVEWHEIPSIIEKDDPENQKETFNKILEKTIHVYLDQIRDKSFVVRVKRAWVHNFKSIDLERYVGAWLLKKLDSEWIHWKVSLRNPEVTVSVEIKDENLYIVKNKGTGIGGYPTGVQDKIISLISGGFDSGVSTYSMMKRWCKVDFLFFNLWGSAHELWVKQVAYYLNNQFSSGYAANIVTVPFEDVIRDLVMNVDHKYRAIILKRCMLKIADKLAQENEYYAIVKWDSLGQVSSQTLKNMFAIDRASETLVLRPLIWFNKQEIVNITKEIWTYDFACNMPEYCGVISDKPATWASLKKVIEAEKVFNESLLFEAFDNKKVEKVTDIIKNAQNHSDEIEIKNFAIDNDVIIDIRDPDTQSKKQLLVENREIISIPFYDINNEFSKLDQTKNYLLYCDKWVMSKLHWLYLLEKWFNNIALFQPIEADKTCWTL